MTDTTAQRRILTAAALRTIADAIQNGFTRTPDKIDFVRYDATGFDLLSIADQTNTRVQHNNGTVWVEVFFGKELDLQIGYTVFTRDTDETWLSQYLNHNRECLNLDGWTGKPLKAEDIDETNPSADGCPDPATHAEAGHDA
jgi:hypothetical protein